MDISFYFLLLLMCISESYSDFTKRIMNGQIVDIEDYPFYVYLNLSDSICGGVLIRRDTVVTAAHCVKGIKTSSVRVVVGLNDTNARKPSTYYVSWYRIHPNYTTHPYFDISVIKLRKNVTLSKAVRPIGISNANPRVGGLVRVVGYGYIRCRGNSTDGGCLFEDSAELRSTVTKVQSYSGHVMITYSVETGACYGDSGSPIIYNGKLVGVVSAVQTLCAGKNYYVSTSKNQGIYRTFLRQYV